MHEKIAIIGAGIAGITAARMLTDAGHSIVLFEKSGGTGGRLSTRRTEFGAFDHGAQYVSVKGAQFRTMIGRLSDHAAVVPWSPPGKDRQGDWYVGSPGMSGLVKPLLDGIVIRKKTRIVEVNQTDFGFDCIADDGTSDRFEKVIVAVPSPQAAALLKPVDPVFEQLDNIVYMPCWTSMFAFESPLDQIFDLFRGDDAMTISWLVRKPAAPGHTASELVVAQAGALWSRENLEIDPSQAAALMQQALEDLAGYRVTPLFAQAHRWRYARVDSPLGTPFLSNDEGTLFAIGDGMLGGRVEAAFESGRLLSEHLIDKT